MKPRKNKYEKIKHLGEGQVNLKYNFVKKFI